MSIIAPFKTGLQLDIQPWLAPPDSFSELNNFHVEHGFLERRNGFVFLPVDEALLTNETPVIGFGTFIQTETGVKNTLAFDTLSAYLYNSSTKTFVQMTPTNIFSGSADDYVWTANWLSTANTNVNRLYFTNGLDYTGSVDGIWYYDGGGSTTVTEFSADLGGGLTLTGGKLIFSISQRLVILYTYEDNDPFPQRARWCAKQNPDGTTGWDDTVAGKGSFVDAATSDQIISAQFLQNKLIVFFTDSVWALLPTSDPNRAFTWKKINNFRALEGKMASVMYDDYVAAVGTRGITGTDGVNTKRIDNNISTFTVENMSQQNLNQTFCLRDYSNRRWWTLYNDTSIATQKTKVLIRDDDSLAYSTYSINLNSLGYAIQGYDYTYEEITADNGFTSPDGGDARYKDFDNDQTYNSFFFQENSQALIGGGYNGEVYILDSGNNDNELPIEASFTSAAWNPYKDSGSEALLSYIDIYLETSPTVTGTVYFYKDTGDTPYKSQNIDFLPNLKFVVNIVNIDQSNPCNVNAPSHGLSTGDVIYIYHVQNMEDVNSTNFASGFTITFVDENNFTLNNIDSSAYSTYTGGGEIYLNEFYRTKTWKRVFAGGIGFQHRIGFTSSGNDQSYRIHGFKPNFSKRGTRMIN